VRKKVEALFIVALCLLHSNNSKKPYPVITPDIQASLEQTLIHHLKKHEHSFADSHLA